MFAVLLSAPGAFATTPLLKSSETSATKLCLEYDRGHAEMREICRTALSDAGVNAATQARVRDNLAHALNKLGAREESFEQLQKALALDPRSDAVLSSLGWHYWDIDDYPAAIDHFERALSIHTTAQALSGLASAKRHNGGPVEASIELLRVALAIEPDYAWAQNELAWIHYREGDDTAAIAAFESAVAIDESYANAYYGLARSLNRQGAYERALEAISTAILEDGGEEADYLIERARLLRRLDRNGAAIRDARAAVEMVPDDPNGYAQWAWAEAALGRTDTALEVFADAIAAVPDSGFLHYWHADLLTDLGQYDLALAAIDAAIGLPGVEAYDHTLRALILMRLKRYDALHGAATQALKLGGDDARALYYQAVAEAADGALETAHERFDAAVGAGLPESFVTDFAAFLASQGQYLSAIAIRMKY